VAYAEGEDERVLRAAQSVIEGTSGAPDPDWPPGVIERALPKPVCA
jgi:hypothetical protein